MAHGDEGIVVLSQGVVKLLVQLGQLAEPLPDEGLLLEAEVHPEVEDGLDKVQLLAARPPPLQRLHLLRLALADHLLDALATLVSLVCKIENKRAIVVSW